MAWAIIYAKYHRFVGSWAYFGHRLSGLALTAYVFLHIWSLKGLQERLPDGVPIDTALDNHSWTQFVSVYTSGIFPLFEWLLFAAVLFHALNGVRILLVDLGNASRYHKHLFWGLTVLGALLFAGMGYLMYPAIAAGLTDVITHTAEGM